MAGGEDLVIPMCLLVINIGGLLHVYLWQLFFAWEEGNICITSFILCNRTISDTTWVVV